MAESIKRAYLDHIAATPLDPRVADLMKAYLNREFANPLSLHIFGDPARAGLEEARRRVAGFIQSDPREILFASCGTEANNLAIKGIATAYRKRGRHIITSSIEHASILHPCRTLEANGFSVTVLPVDRWGMVDPESVARAIRSDTILVSIQWANNEIGTLQPIEEIARITREREIPFHTDAIAAAGRVPVDVASVDVDALSLASNQLYGPQGAAALFLRRGVRLTPLLEGGVQEGGRRAGSENVAAIIGFGLAAELARTEFPRWQMRLKEMQRRLYAGLKDRLQHVTFTGHPEKRLPGLVSLCVEFVEGEALIRSLGQHGIAAATGSACRDYSTRKVSHVLEALGLDIRLAQGSLVFMAGKDTSEADIAYALEILPQVVDRLRSISPVYAEGIRDQAH